MTARLRYNASETVISEGNYRMAKVDVSKPGRTCPDSHELVLRVRAFAASQCVRRLWRDVFKRGRWFAATLAVAAAACAPPVSPALSPVTATRRPLAPATSVKTSTPIATATDAPHEIATATAVSTASAMATLAPLSTSTPSRTRTLAVPPTLTRPPTASAFATTRVDTAIARGIEYLHKQFDGEMRLLREAPNVAPNKFWLFNDNALAAHALQTLGDREMAATLFATLQGYSYAKNDLEEVLWGATVPWPPRVPVSTTLKQSGAKEVWIELAAGENRFEDWADYTNLAMLGALNEYQSGHHANASRIYQASIAGFDRVGLRDKAFAGEYETYKLALALYTGLVIEALPGDLTGSLVNALLQKQAPSGGFHTHYAGPTTLRGDTNTETTCLALLALDRFRQSGAR